MSTRIATAEWADPDLVEGKYLYRDGDVWLGRSPTDKQLPIGYHDDRHVCLVSGSRAGKGTSSIINNLCLWPGSVVVVDPKGENATVTAPRRGKGSADCIGLGQSVHVLDPFNAAQVDESYRARFNPLDAMDPSNEETIDEAARIADAIVVIHESNDPFWDESARAMVKGLILHVLTAPEYESRRNLITLRKLITRGDWEAVEALRQAGEQDIPPAQGLLWTSMAKNPVFEGVVAGIGDTFTNMLLNSPKQFESVLQVANRNTEFIDSPAMQRCLGASDFDLAGLKTSHEGMSLYLSLPQRFMSTHYRWLRMMISLTVSEMEIVRGRPAAGFPVLILLDEFAGLKRMEAIEHAVAQIAGYGVKLFFVLQSLEQLKAVYKDNWETFLSNSGLKIFFSLDDHFSREYVSKLVGETEVIREVHSASESESESDSVSHSLSSSRTQGRSVSDGTSRSSSDSESRGTNSSISRSKGRSWGESWTPQGFFFTRRENMHASRGRNFSKSRTEGTSQGWSHSDTDGVSHGTSESYGYTTGETHGTTHSTSLSRTTGASETIHRRALVTPDEIGHLFARINDAQQGGYPGLALVVISGERAIALQRVNYYEDLEFIARFEPHPDYPSLRRWTELTVSCSGFTPYDRYFTSGGIPESQITGWAARAGQIVSAGDPVVLLEYQDTPVSVRAPYAGMITKLPEVIGGGTVNWLFGLRYCETRELETDPFCDFAAFARQFTVGVRERMAKARKSVWIMSGLGVLFVIGLIGMQNLSALAVVGIAAFLVSRKAAEISKCSRILAGCPKELLGSAGLANSSFVLDENVWRIQEKPGLGEQVAQAPLPPAQSTAPDVSVSTTPATPAVQPPALPEQGIQTADPAAPQPLLSAPAKSEPVWPTTIPARAMDEEAQTAAPEPVAVAEKMDESVRALPGEEVPPPVEAPQELAAEQVTVSGPAETMAPQPAAAAWTGEAESMPEMPKVPASPPPAIEEVRLSVIVQPPVTQHFSQASSPNAQTAEAPSGRDTTGLGAIVEPLPPQESPPPEVRSEAGSSYVAQHLAAQATSMPTVATRKARFALVSVGVVLVTVLAGVVIAKFVTTSGEVTPGVEVELAYALNAPWKVNSVALGGYGNQLAAGSADDNTVTVWDMDTRKILRSLKPDMGRVVSMAFSPDANLNELASAGDRDIVVIFQAGTGKVLRQVQAHKDMVRAVAFNHYGNLMASGSDDFTVKIWDTSTWRQVHVLMGHTDSVPAVAFSPDGRVLASGSDDKTVKIWDVALGQELRTLRGHQDNVATVAFSPDGVLLASGCGDGTVKIWDVASGRELRTLRGHRQNVFSVAFSPDGLWLASGGADGTIRIWDVASGGELRTVSADDNFVMSLAFTERGELVSGSWDRTVKVWKVTRKE